MRLIRALLAGALIVGCAASAEAALIEFEDVFTPDTAPTLSGQHDLYEYDHFITLQLAHPSTNVLTTTIDGVAVAGADYDPSTDILTKGMLSLFFDVPDTNQGRFDLFLDGQQFLDHQLFTATVTIGTVAFDVGLLANDGRLTVLIDRANASGEVIFTGSILSVEGTRGATGEPSPQNPIPEPASLVLFGLGAVAAGHRLRRRPAC